MNVCDGLMQGTSFLNKFYLALLRKHFQLPGDNGTMYFWDWKTGYNFQRFQATAQPGSLDSESGIFALTFDQSQSRMITCEADKTVKIYREDDTAVCTHTHTEPSSISCNHFDHITVCFTQKTVVQLALQRHCETNFLHYLLIAIFLPI